jgi:hypothetical protein
MFYSSKHRKINITGLFSKELRVTTNEGTARLGPALPNKSYSETCVKQNQTRERSFHLAQLLLYKEYSTIHP